MKEIIRIRWPEVMRVYHAARLKELLSAEGIIVKCMPLLISSQLRITFESGEDAVAFKLIYGCRQDEIHAVIYKEEYSNRRKYGMTE